MSVSSSSPEKNSTPSLEWLTHGMLQEAAGPRTFKRGMLCFAQRRVVSHEAAGDELHGKVLNRHGKPQEVVLSTDADGLSCECECTAFWSHGICKHIVALGLAFLASRQPPGEATEEPPAKTGRPRTPKAIEAWLEAHQVPHARRESVSGVLPLLPSNFRGPQWLSELGHLPITAVLDGTLDLSRRVQGNLQQALLVEAAWKWLDLEARRVRLGLEHEREQAGAPPPPLTDARLEPWRHVLVQERARVRAQAVPRLLTGPSTVTVHERPLRLYVEEPRRTPETSWSSMGFVPKMRVSVDPRALLEGRAGLSCWCTPHQAAACCVHALSALDALLESLSDPEAVARNARLAELLFVEPSRQLLGAIEKVSAAPSFETAGQTHRVVFRLEGLEQRAPRLQPYLQRRLKKGGFSSGAAVKWAEAPEVRAALSSPEEGEALDLCGVLSQLPRFTEGYALLLRAIRLLASSAHLFLPPRLDAPVQVREASLGFTFAEAGEGLSVHPALEGAVLNAQDLVPPPAGHEGQWPWMLAEPVVPRLTLVSIPPGAQGLLATLREYGTRLPPQARPELLRHLSRFEAAFPVSLPESLEARAVPPTPGFLLRLAAGKEDQLEGKLLVRPLPEAPPWPPGEGPPVLRGLRAGERVMTRRDLEAEHAEARGLRERLGLPVDAAAPGFVLEGSEAALDFLERLEPLTGPSLRVEWAHAPWKVSNSPDAEGLKVEVRKKRDWFGLEGSVNVEGLAVELAPLLEAVLNHRRFVPLGKGRFLRLSQSLREQLAPLADLAHPTREGLEVSAAAAPVLDALAEAGVEVHAPPDWRRLATRVRRAQELEIPVPPALKAELRDYQREGFTWMARLAEWGGGGCLADDMGLGKTLQTLTLLLHRAKEGPALVVAPTSVCFNWAREAERFAPSLRVKSYRDADRERLLTGLKAGDVLLVSYGLLVRDAERFAAVSFATLVVDEAQAAKNPDSARAQALQELQADARIALSGTPVENRLSELWSLFRIVFPGLLGGREVFRKRFAAPIEREGNREARAALSRIIRPFLLRRTKAEVARELPPRIETVVSVVLSEGERQLYEAARVAALLQLESRTEKDKRFMVLAALTRLRLLACHPRLWDEDSPLPSSKLERMVERVEVLRAEGSRALIFSQFVRLLEFAREALEARGITCQYLDGQTPVAERQARVEAFQRGEGEVFLISLKAGGTGLNLTAADHVLHLDPWWNPAVEDQATDRAYRIGQTRPVTVSRLVSEGTIEEAILALHAQKRELALSLLSEADGAAALSPEQLMDLLRFTPGA
ncbi:DEAD/DEAH box helicase [Stigmatella erecta]|uniref:Superfamily II DNA or RNA helicase, SNF2 family n=1 Tax=Stigmatella erecta TaxID=83460 RepID=A0A1I0GNE3_9BACT|nr:DEAD/DEAH box helicase [Stigmatella erecta]SET71775.1 Superfamily II DNA or RNA helicase, SNF2 family [Stigmatella erecta]